MGRAKLNMELISKEKSRNITFRKRKEGLIRKMHEFTTLCDVSACMIIYGPNGASAEPEIWPQNGEEVRRIIEIYKAKNNDSGNKTFGLSDFFYDRKRKIEEELAKLRKKNMEAKYPTWIGGLDFMTEGQLREFAAGLSSKAEYVKSRIELLRRANIQALTDINSFVDFTPFYTVPPLGIGGGGIDNQQAAAAISMATPIAREIPIHYPVIQKHQPLNHDSMMMLLMNDNIDQFGGASSSTTNIQPEAFKRQAFHESSSSTGGHRIGDRDPDPLVCHNQWQFARYYAQSLRVPPLLPPPPPPPLFMAAPPQLQFSNNDGSVHDENKMKSHGTRYQEYKDG